jgi:hypothetical protein
MIFENAIFTEMILPFLFVFVAVFAILQKSKIFENAQVDAIVGLVVGLILIGFPTPRDILINIMPWLAVGVAVIFVFLVLWGFVAGDLSKAVTPNIKNTFLGLAALFTIGVVWFVTGAGDILMDSFGNSGEVWMNIVMILVVVVAVAVALKGGGSGGGNGEKPGE